MALQPIQGVTERWKEDGDGDMALVIAPEATVAVYNEATGALAPLFAERDGLSGLPNPFASDEYGRFSCYVNAVRVKLLVTTAAGEIGLFRNAAVGDAGARNVGTATGEVPLAEDVLLQGGIFESAEQAIPGTAGIITIAHGLGALPRFHDVYLRCKTAELGYSVGDEASPISFEDTAGNKRYVETSADATNIVVGMDDGTLVILRKDTGLITGITAASWKIVARAIL